MKSSFEVTSEEFYGKGKILYSSEEKLWNSTDSDYNTYQNLLKGLIPDISMLSPVSKEHATDHFNQLPDNMKLTDGEYATKTTYTDPAYFRMTSGDGRVIIFDLGALSTVNKLEIGFLKEASTGVSLPVQVFIYGSADGSGWQSLGVSNNNYCNEENAIVRIKKDFNKAYNIRYLKIYIIVANHAYCDEIELFGTKKIQPNGAAIKPEEEPVISYRNRYITPDEFLDVHNMLLSYHCLETSPGSGVHAERGLITVDQYLPHIGYYDTNGKLTDTLFDSFLYLPYTAFNYSDRGRSADGWKFYLDNAFTKDRNVAALDQATKVIKDELKLDRNYKSKIFFSIMYTFPKLRDNNTKNPFGDIDDDGIIEDFSKIEDRKKSIKWIIDQYLQRYSEGDYKHLELSGFYWFEEHIAYSDPHEIELLTFARDYVHSLGYKLFWIPYFRATGYNDWANLGFDMTCMQPNYAFIKDADISRLYSNAEITKLLGMCVEIEVNDAKIYNDVKRFKEYLYVGAETGYMNAVKIYYQGGVPGAFYSFYQSEDLYMRSAYDELYLFAKGKLVPPEDFKNLKAPE